MVKEAISTWDEVDNALKEISENTNEIEIIETELTEKLTNAQDKAAKLASPLKEKMKFLEDRIKDFVEKNKNDLDGKSKQLNFGQVGFRKSVKTELTGKLEDIINSLRKHKMNDCIEIKESVNKNIMKKYTDYELEKVGVKRVAEENFFIKLTKGKCK